MADSTVKKKKSSPKTSAKPKSPVFTKRNIRLSIGFFLLILGAFFTLSVVSYFFTWQKDQDHLISSLGLAGFLFHDQSVVENWGGRLGAAAAHMFVFRGFGLVSLLFTAWVAILGFNLVNGKVLISTRRWPKWMAFGLLFFCPLLALTFIQSAFPFGGAVGSALIDWSNGFLGPLGTVFLLCGIGLFFLFVVFQYDLKPALRSVKTWMPAAANHSAAEIGSEEEEPFKGYQNPRPEPETSIDVEPAQAAETSDTGRRRKSGNSLRDNGTNESELVIHAPVEEDVLTIFEQEPEKEPKEKKHIHLELPDEAPQEQQDGDDIGFEVKTTEDESVVPKHGSHISIQSQEPYDPSLDLPHYKFPTLDLLEEAPSGMIALDREELDKNKNQIVHTLRSFGIEIQQIFATVGPTVTLYEIVPAEGVRISKIRNLEDDIALNLAALGIRIIAPIPGKGTIGIEVPNTKKQIVYMRTLLSSEKFVNNKMSLPIALGKKIDNENYIVDLATMPHLLMAGATGQGKSVGINAILISLLYKKHPSQLKFVMVDPKKVELSIYRLIEKHYLAKLPNEEEPIITDTKKVINTLSALCIEMDNRYELLKDGGARNIKEYNEKFIKRRLNPENGHKYLPFIVLVIDEFADLIMTAGKEVEMPIARLAQLARAVGIHIVIATQRPSVNVITGIIKANFPGRIAFKVSAKVDSRTILDSGGAEQLIGRGDMLVSHGSELFRLQCAFVDTPEVERIVQFIGEQRGYPSAFELPEYEGAEDEYIEKGEVDLTRRDAKFEECARIVVTSQNGSTSMLQRKLSLGYNRAGKIMDQLEAAGIVGPQSGSKPRDVLVSTEYELDNILATL